MNDERRNYSRVKFDAELAIIFGDHELTSRLLDISLKGALVELEGAASVDKGTHCKIQIKLNGNNLVMDFEGEAVFVKDSHVGFEFVNIELESLTHLRRLVELNVGDSDKVKNELFFLATHRTEDKD
ncbi:MAG: PilZ domain-containing protein [SAR324 cluster bacterium]|nr:PilZ domain-containing protein [SAR324 cluster bacterium]